MNPVPLPAGSTLGQSFEYGLDVNLGTYGAPQWQPVRRMTGFNPSWPEITADVQTYDNLGEPDEDVTGRGFSAGFNVQVNRSLGTGLYLPEVEKILAAAKAIKEGALIDVRFYHKPKDGTPNPNDAGRALCRTSATRAETGNTGVESLAVSLSGKGAYQPIVNPFTGWGGTAPTIAHVGPDGAGDGDLLTITGEGLLSATAVTIDGDPAEFLSINAGTVVVQLPLGDAGAVPVIVTTPAGSSPAYTFNRGA